MAASAGDLPEYWNSLYLCVGASLNCPLLFASILLRRLELQPLQFKFSGLPNKNFQISMLKKVDNYTYNTASILGSGTSSVVYLGNSLLTNQIVAVRIIALRKLVPETWINLQNQMAVLSYLPPHSNIVKFHCLLQTQNHVYIITQYCDSKLETEETYYVSYIASGIIEGLRHLIKHNVVHRDLKPQNIMLRNGIPKLIDFGFSIIISHPNQMMLEHFGTLYYDSDICNLILIRPFNKSR